ncbi:ABC transporter substrate-binding protein [Streptomyces hygroscopicus]|uniref:ABC transporter substrate-binding protein n=1 Tax=Streptomyces hygroscopicus TaxID=1912 RepID=UPI00099E2830|nr:ABC transporter substrate-binding protein [Streptomyces hygroscopicus]
MDFHRSALPALCAVSSALALTVAVTGCGSPTASAGGGKGGALVVAGYGGSFETAFHDSVLPTFEKSCGCKVTYIPGSSTDTVAKLKAQRAHPQIDVALVDDGPQAQALQAGLLASIDTKVVPVDHVVKIARMENDSGVGFGLTATGIAYNPEWFAEHGVPKPTTWEDLANPKLKDKVVLPSITNTYGVGLLVGASRANGGSERDVGPGFTAVREIAGNAVTFDTTADVSNYFLQGQAAASVWGVSRTSTLADKDFPIAFVYPKDGAIALVTTANVVKKAPHQELAQKFVAHLLEPSVQRALAKATYDGSVIRGVKEDPALKNKVVSADKVDSLLKLDWKTINKNRAAWTDTWNKRVESK